MVKACLALSSATSRPMGASMNLSALPRPARVGLGISAALLLFVAVVNLSAGAPAETRLSSEGPLGSTDGITTTSFQDAPVSLTTTTTGPPTTTSARRSTTTRPARNVATTATTESWQAPPWPISPLEPGESAWGTYGYGASRDVENGSTQMTAGIYPRDAYVDGTGEGVGATAEIDDPGRVTLVQIDFGDGTSWQTPDGIYGRWCSPDRPRPIYYQAPDHDYSQPGDYTVSVRVTTRSCDGGNRYGDPATDRVTEAAVVAHVHPGTRPTAPPYRHGG